MKLEKGAIKPLQCKKTLKVLIKSVKEFTGINFNISSNKPKAWSLLLHRCLKKFQKTFQRTSKWLLSNYDFFLKVSELNIKLDEPSLKEWIHLWIPVTFRSSFYWYLCKKSFLNLEFLKFTNKAFLISVVIFRSFFSCQIKQMYLI